MTHTVTEAPAIFQAESVREILSGRKTQTRRVVKFGKPLERHELWKAAYPHPGRGWIFLDHRLEGDNITNQLFRLAQGREGKLCPYGNDERDRIWVKESFAHFTDVDGMACVTYRADDHARSAIFADDGEGDFIGLGTRVVKPMAGNPKWRSPIYMRRIESRLTLELTAPVRVQRVQDITEEDAKAEALQDPAYWRATFDPGQSIAGDAGRRTLGSHPYTFSFAVAWDEINAARGFPWKDNPWVFVLSFRRYA